MFNKERLKAWAQRSLSDKSLYSSIAEELDEESPNFDQFGGNDHDRGVIERIKKALGGSQ